MSIQQNINSALGTMGQAVAIGKGIKKFDESTKLQQESNDIASLNQQLELLDKQAQYQEEIDTTKESLDTIKEEVGNTNEQLIQLQEDEQNINKFTKKGNPTKKYKALIKAQDSLKDELSMKEAQQNRIERQFNIVKNKQDIFNNILDKSGLKDKLTIDKSELEKIKGGKK